MEGSRPLYASVDVVTKTRSVLGSRHCLREISNVSNELIRAKRSENLKCLHGAALKDWKKGCKKRVPSAVALKQETKDQLKLNLLPCGQADSKKEIIEDIDKLYEGNVFLVKEYAKHIYQYLSKLEVKYKLKKWSPKSPSITPSMRLILVDWLVDVHVEYRLQQETIHLAIYILDKFVQSELGLNKENFQLVGICALYLACKYEEMFTPLVEDYIALCKGSFSKDEFFAMEQKILLALDFQMSRPTPIVFLRRFNMAAKADKLQHVYAKYFLDLVLLDYNFCHYRPSMIAAAASYLAMCIVNANPNAALWNPTMVHYSTYTFIAIKPLASTMAKMIIASTRSKYDSVKRKYAHCNFHAVSLKIYAYLELLKRVALD